MGKLTSILLSTFLESRRRLHYTVHYPILYIPSIPTQRIKEIGEKQFDEVNET